MKYIAKPSTTTEADLTAVLAEAPKADDHAEVRDYLHALIDRGLAVLLIYPGCKTPYDGRAPRQKIAADKAAQTAAKAAGLSNWQKVKSEAGVHLATTNAAVLDGYIDRYIETFGDSVEINVAVSLGRSRLVVVDCDTAAQLAAFLADAGAPEDTEPTVRTPGSCDAAGTWVHSDGGHFYFTVPEDLELPDRLESMAVGTGDDAYAVLWGPGKYVVTLPSVRTEGPYALTGEVHEIPASLVETITDYAEKRSQRAEFTRSSGSLSRIEEWGSGRPWAEILASTEWANTGKPDACGCDVWAAPGVHASPKSATAHEPGCAVWADSPDPPLHIWTDHDIEPFDGLGSTITRLQAVAAIDHNGNVGAAMEALQLHDAPVTIDRRSPARLENLPEEFWAADPVLQHIRQAAHRGVNSADAVLGAGLARLAAHLDPTITVDTGVKDPMPLNMFVGAVGSAGSGKSSAFAAAGSIFAFVLPDPNLVELTAADEVPMVLPVGSGPGVAEAYMGLVAHPLEPKNKRREQVRHKVLFHCDEGAGLVSGITGTRRGDDIGPTLRAAWTGAVLGQANASAERKREVRNYVIGLYCGFQLEALADLSTPEQLEYGTPQRFVYVSATDTHIPDTAPTDPGPVRVRLPRRPLRYSTDLQRREWNDALTRARGEAEHLDPIDAHRPALRARLAALLVALCDPERDVVEQRDVDLAEMVIDSSIRLHGRAMEWRREREAERYERRASERISEQVAAAVAVDARDDTLSRLRGRLMDYLDKDGGSATWSGRGGLRQKFRSEERCLADTALTALTDTGVVVCDGNTIRRV